MCVCVGGRLIAGGSEHGTLGFTMYVPDTAAKVKGLVCTAVVLLAPPNWKALDADVLSLKPALAAVVTV